jgi:hypothetical protein
MKSLIKSSPSLQLKKLEVEVESILANRAKSPWLDMGYAWLSYVLACKCHHKSLVNHPLCQISDVSSLPPSHGILSMGDHPYFEMDSCSCNLSAHSMDHIFRVSR